MQEATLAYGADFAVAKEPGEAERSEPLLDELSIVIWLSEHPLAAAVATAQTTAINRRVFQVAMGSGEQRIHIFSGCGGGASLKLDGLPKPGSRAHSDSPGTGVGAEEVANQEVAAMKVLQVFIDHQSDEQVSPRALLVLG